MPTSLISVQPGPYEITLDLNFDGPLSSDISTLSSANYKLTNGAYTRKVEQIVSNQVRIWIEKFYGYPTFELNILNVKDIHDDPILGVPVSISPFYSTANIGNYNGLVRTKHDSRFVVSDSQRIYLAGSKGIDILKKERKLVNKTWAQVFDNYGIESMFVANFPNEVIFVDTQPPYISYAMPYDGGEAYPDSHIIFEISDAITSAEISSVKVYINDSIIFDGSYDGWFNNFSGNVDVNYKKINFDILPPSSAFIIGSYYTVRIIASDLMNNQMDYSYTFLFTSV